MKGLAQALKIQTPSLYSHVGGLREVRRLLAIHGLEALNTEAAHAAIGKSGADAVRTIFDAYRKYAKENPGIYVCTVPTPPRSDREWSGAVDRLIQTFYAAFQSYGLRGREIIHALRGFRSLVHGFVSLELAGALMHPVSRDESFRWLVDSYLAALETMASRSRTRGSHSTSSAARRS
jgi:hypothetical protein